MPTTTTRNRNHRKTASGRSSIHRVSTGRRSGTRPSVRTASPFRSAFHPQGKRAKKDYEIHSEHLESLLLQAVETERGGIRIYRTALRCVQNPELRKEWEGYLDETRNHERILMEVCERFGVDPDRETPDRQIVGAIGESLVNAMESALQAGEPEGAELVAAECVTLAETKDHLNWQLIGEVVKGYDGPGAAALKEAHDEVEDQEDEHLYHTMGWCRELWLQFLGVPAVLPPPEEKKDVKSMAGAARAAKQRKPKTASRKKR